MSPLLTCFILTKKAKWKRIIYYYSVKTLRNLAGDFWTTPSQHVALDVDVTATWTSCIIVRSSQQQKLIHEHPKWETVHLCKNIIYIHIYYSVLFLVNILTTVIIIIVIITDSLSLLLLLTKHKHALLAPWSPSNRILRLTFISGNLSDCNTLTKRAS